MFGLNLQVCTEIPAISWCSEVIYRKSHKRLATGVGQIRQQPSYKYPIEWNVFYELLTFKQKYRIKEIFIVTSETKKSWTKIKSASLTLNGFPKINILFISRWIPSLFSLFLPDFQAFTWLACFFIPSLKIASKPPWFYWNAVETASAIFRTGSLRYDVIHGISWSVFPQSLLIHALE